MPNNKCPICEQASTPECAPFCSKTCKNIDLLKWMNEKYTIPVLEDDEKETSSTTEEDKR
jgi:endogenous inhibitor of DNA gyrase (YacG/DUF329 family)